MAIRDFRVNRKTIIDRSKKSISTYFHDIYYYQPLEGEQEAELASIIRKGGKDADIARERLIKANLRFVISIANSFNTNSLELEDLISEGNLGLIKAAEHFDETRGFKFITYAVWWIRKSIMNAIANYDNALRIPHNLQSIYTEYCQMQKDVMQRENRSITIDEFCEVSGYDRDRVASVISASFKPINMDGKLSDDDDTTYGDFYASDLCTSAHLDEESLRLDILDVIDEALNPREAFVVKKMAGIGCERMQTEDVARGIDLSVERTRQVYRNAIKKMRLSPLSSRLSAHLAA